MKKEILRFVKRLNKEFHAYLSVSERARKNGYDVKSLILSSNVTKRLIDFALSYDYHFYISTDRKGLVVFSIYNNDNDD